MKRRAACLPPCSTGVRLFVLPTPRSTCVCPQGTRNCQRQQRQLVRAGGGWLGPPRVWRGTWHLPPSVLRATVCPDNRTNNPPFIPPPAQLQHHQLRPALPAQPRHHAANTPVLDVGPPAQQVGGGSGDPGGGGGGAANGSLQSPPLAVGVVRRGRQRTASRAACQGHP